MTLVTITVLSYIHTLVSLDLRKQALLRAPCKMLGACYALGSEESNNKDDLGLGVPSLHTGLVGPTFPGIVTVNPEIQFAMACGCNFSQHSHFCRDN